MTAAAKGKTMPVTVSELALATVKGMRLQRAGEIQVGRHGVAGDREFLVVGHDVALVQTSQTPSLLQVEPAWDPAGRSLTLTFPGGDVISGTAEAGHPAVTRMYDGRELPGLVIPGPLSTALSDYLGQAVDLFRRAPGHIGTDDQPVTLMSQASLQALAAELDGAVPDPRRFRMNITITGSGPWAEHAWPDRQAATQAIRLRRATGRPVRRGVRRRGTCPHRRCQDGTGGWRIRHSGRNEI